jgi:hypothetical protein
MCQRYLPGLEWTKTGNCYVDELSRRLAHHRPTAPADLLGHHGDESGSASFDDEEG